MHLNIIEPFLQPFSGWFISAKVNTELPCKLRCAHRSNLLGRWVSKGGAGDMFIGSRYDVFRRRICGH